jgi:hypothetical protein
MQSDIQIEKDGSGNLFAEVENIRITYQLQSKRGAEKDWAGSDVIRIQAYRGDKTQSRSLFPGAELPIQDEAAFIEFLQALCAVYRVGKSSY